MQAAGVAEAGASRPAQAATPPPVLFGLALFLASETMFFAGLFAVWFTLRQDTQPWPPGGIELDPVLAAAGTVVLVVSSATIVAAMRAMRARRLPAMRGWVWATIALGGGFLAFEVADWIRQPFWIDTNAFGSIFFALTGFHALHVSIGLLFLVVLLVRIARGAYDAGPEQGPEAISYYWHFVDVVWVLVFTTIWVLG
jgi:cytochrome c oxidase subunit 3